LRHDDVSQIGDHAEVTRAQLKVDLLARSRLEMNALKSAKGPAGRAGDIGEPQVEFDDFISGDFSSVRNVTEA